MKLDLESNVRHVHHVAPCAGAWIETETALRFMRRMRSPPARGRGLKPIMTEDQRTERRRPLRGGVD